MIYNITPNDKLNSILNKALENKVDKEEGKGLSSNDFSQSYIDSINNKASLTDYPGVGKLISGNVQYTQNILYLKWDEDNTALVYANKEGTGNPITFATNNDIEVSLYVNPSLSNDEQIALVETWSDANIVGVGQQTIKAFGNIPSIIIPVVVKEVYK